MLPEAVESLALSLFIVGLALMAGGLAVLVFRLPGMTTVDRACVLIGIGVLAWIAGATSLGWPE